MNLKRPPALVLRRLIIGYLIPLSLTGIVLALLIRKADLDELKMLLGSISASHLCLILVIALINVAVSTWRYQWVVKRHIGRQPPWTRLFELNLITILVAHAVPIGAIADGLRAALSRSWIGISGSDAIQTVLYDRLIALFSILVIGLLLLGFQPKDEGAISIVFTQQVIVFAGGLAAIGCAKLIAVTPRYHFPQWLNFAVALVDRLFASLRTPLDWSIQGLLGLGCIVSYAMMMYIAIHALGLSEGIGFWTIITVTPAIYLAQNLPIFYLGWGARELTVVTLFQVVSDLGTAQALSVSVVVGACIFISSLPALASLIRIRRG